MEARSVKVGQTAATTLLVVRAEKNMKGGQPVSSEFVVWSTLAALEIRVLRY
jgi:hypothetical protein